MSADFVTPEGRNGTTLLAPTAKIFKGPDPKPLPTKKKGKRK